jgi:hypothetical protein
MAKGNNAQNKDKKKAKANPKKGAKAGSKKPSSGPKGPDDRSPVMPRF